MRTLTIAITLILLLSAPVFAGSIEQTKAPDNVDTKMWTLEQIYNRLYSGAVDPDGKHGAQFYEPGGAPGSTMFTLDDIYGSLDTDATACSGTLAANVLAGKTFFATSGTVRGTSWGPVIGTANTPPGSGSAAGESQVLTGYYAFNAAGTAMSGTASSGGLPRTGQIIEYQEGDDGTYHAGKPAYPAVQYTDTPGTTNSVTDNGTGLIWIKSHAAIGTVDIYDFASTMNWSNALLAITALNGTNYDGSNQWRLPNAKELQSIVDYSNVNPSIDTDFFTSQSSNYWSSTTSPATADSAWHVSFYYGYVYGAATSSNYYVRPVRGG